MKFKDTILTILRTVQPMLPLKARLLVAALIAIVERAIPDDAELTIPVGAAPDSVRPFLEDVFRELKARYVPESFSWVVDVVSGIVLDRFVDIVWDALFPPENAPVMAKGPRKALPKSVAEKIERSVGKAMEANLKV